MAAVAAFVLYAFDPVTTPIYPPCVFFKLTGWQCPGCGTARALHALFHGQIGAAFRYNPALLLASAPAVLIALRPALLRKRWTGWIAVAVLVMWGMGRNLVN